MKQPNPDQQAKRILSQLAKQTKLQVAGGKVRRTSSRFCLGVEHGDYNGTELFGVGTDRFIWLAYKPNGTDRVRLFSGNFPNDGIVDFKLGDVPAPKSAAIADTWARFPYGVDFILHREGFKLTNGFDAVLYGNIPGGGMSRSASLCINLMLTFFDVNGIKVKDGMKIVDMAQAVENDYVGSPCGKLDQIMIYFARAGMGTHYNPKNRSISYVPLGKGAIDFRIVSLDTGTVRPGLEKSTYKIRRAECEELVALAGKEFGFSCLADIRDAGVVRPGDGQIRRIASPPLRPPEIHFPRATTLLPDDEGVESGRHRNRRPRSSVRTASACATTTRFPVPNWKRCATSPAASPAS